MTWQYIDQGTHQWLAAAGNPPGSIEGVLGDPGWATVYMRWADEYCLTVQDVDLQSASQMIVSMHEGQTLQQLWDKYASPDSGENLQIENHDAQLHTDFDNAVRGQGDAEDVQGRLWNYLVGYLRQYYDPFVADVDQLVGVSDPQVAGHIDPRDFDQSVIDGVNEHNLKQMQDPGSVISFFQARELVLIGDGFPMEYVRYAANAGSGGTITIVSRGGIGSTGEILVEGASDQDRFKEAIRRFSKKKITFA
jgi:hypothetical protein